VISPLTTLVAAEVAFNGLTPAQARESVQQDLGLENQDPLADYAATRDSGLRGIARAAAIVLGQSSSAGRSARHRMAESTTQLKSELPSVIKELGLDTAPRSPVSVASVKGALAMSAAPSAPLSAGVQNMPTGTSRFVVKFRDSVANPHERGRNMAGASRGQLRHSYSRSIKGFALTVPVDAVEAFLEAASRNPDVEYVEADQVVTTLQTVQPNATWGLDRTDQRNLPLSRSYSYFGTGAGVKAYIIDTGIRATHVDFEGRVAPGFSAIDDRLGTTDCNGHGTHVAGTVGGKTWGMAKGVTLVPVRVLDCSGAGLVSEVIAGIDWMVANNTGPAVANLSLGGVVSLTLDAAVARAVSSGITVAVAAGNSSENACNSSPAREPSALTVGATANSDWKATFSNFGVCVDIFGPGDAVTSAGITSDSASTVKSGTSMASPHVAGLAALYLQSHRGASPSEVATVLKLAATPGKIKNPGAGSPNALLYTGLDSVSPPTPPISSPEPPISSPQPPISSPQPPISSPQPPISSPQPPISSPQPPPVTSISVAALSGAGSLDAGGWHASVTVAAKSALNHLVAGVVVRGNFTAGGSNLACTTAPNGTCVISSGLVGSKTMQVRFSVTSLTLSGVPYDPSLNTATFVVVSKP
jgi:hypothetical protein